MPELPLKDAPEPQKPIIKELGDNRELKDKLLDTHTEELIIGLCCPIGTDIHFVAEEIKQVIEEKFNYEVEIIRLSDFIKERKKSNQREHNLLREETTNLEITQST